MCKQVSFLISAAPGPDFATTEAADDGKQFGKQKANDKFCNNLLRCINGICLFQPMLMRADSMALSYILTILRVRFRRIFLKKDRKNGNFSEKVGKNSLFLKKMQKKWRKWWLRIVNSYVSFRARCRKRQSSTNKNHENE